MFAIIYYKLVLVLVTPGTDHPTPRPGNKYDLPEKDMKSWMWEHTRDMHAGQIEDQGGMLDYTFQVSGSFQRCLQCQIDEGMRMV